MDRVVGYIFDHPKGAGVGIGLGTIAGTTIALAVAPDWVGLVVFTIGGATAVIVSSLGVSQGPSE